jgi:peptidoglycan/xylan/chitin deacetylase (PgdA/CDA1 family)
MSLRYRVAPVLLLMNRLIGRAHGLRVLLFHDVPPDQAAAFQALVARLAAAGRLVSPDEAEAVLRGDIPARPGACLLSFDDGFASNHRMAKTVLARHGAKGLFFLCPALIDLAPDAQRAAIAANIFDGRLKVSDLPAGMRLMTWDEVGELAADGHAIGNHTAHHLRLTTLSAAQRTEEIAGAAEQLERRLGAPARWFAYTFGDIASIDAACLGDIGQHHQFCRSGVRGANDAGTLPMAIRADQVELTAPPAWQWLAVEGGLDFRYRAERRCLDRYALER